MASEQGQGTPALTSPTTTVQSSPQPTSEKKPDGARKQRTCVSVIKGEACRTQMEGKVCPYNHEGAPAAETLTRVYVCHLPLTFTNDDIQKLAAPHGKIQESRILVDPRTNMSRGVAFVHYERHEDAENAIKSLNELKLPGHATALAARYARRTRPGRRPRRRSRSRSPPRRLRRRSRSRSPPRRRRPGRRRGGYRSYDDEFDDYDYDAYYPRRRPNYPPYEDDYDPVGPERGYAPYGRMQQGRSGTGYTTYTPPSAGGGTNPVGSTAGPGSYNTQPSSYGYGSQQTNNPSGRVDGYRSFPQSGQYNQSTDYGAPARY